MYLCKNPATRRRFHNSLMSSGGKYVKKNCYNFVELYLIELLLCFFVFGFFFFSSTVFFKNYNGGIQLLLSHLYIFHTHSFYIHIKRNLLIQQIQSDMVWSYLCYLWNLGIWCHNSVVFGSPFFFKYLCSYFVCEHKESREPTYKSLQS